MLDKGLWYVRRDNEVRGPFPAELVTRYILLGRVRDGDELSVDREFWRSLAELPYLYPVVMRGDANDPAVRERIEAARRREDERAADDRRGTSIVADAQARFNRRATDRRRPEPFARVQHRAAMAVLQRRLPATRESYVGVVAVTLAVVLGIGVWLWLAPPQRIQSKMQCDAPPQPGVNWSNCRHEGMQLARANLTQAQLRNANLIGADLRGAMLASADLAYANLSMANLVSADLRGALLLGATLRQADLSGADLQDADLSFVNLTGAELAGANLRGAKLDRAIWFDGTVCRPGSIGACVAR